jgi:hypothetical protein
LTRNDAAKYYTRQPPRQNLTPRILQESDR